MPEMAKKTEKSVATGFANLIALLNLYADDIKLQCAEAAMEGELETSGALLETSRNLLVFGGEVKTLSERWSKRQLRFPTSISKNHRSIKTEQKTGHYHKAAKTRLRVTVAGKVINGGSAAEVFSAVLERIGLERMSQLGMRLSGIPLVSRHPATGYQGQIHKQGWYITTHASNKDKKRMLDKIGAALRIPIDVKIDT